MRNIFDYTLASITRHGYKNLVIAIIFGVLVWLIACVTMITNSLSSEYRAISESFPDILVQKNYGGRTHWIEEEILDEFYSMPSVSSVEGRVWGQYYFERNRIYLTIFGVKSFTDYYQNEIKEIAENFPENQRPPMFVTSQSVLDVLGDDLKLYGSIPFFTPDGTMINVNKGGTFKFNHSLENNDIILLDEDIARRILGVGEGLYTDGVVRVANPNEASFVAGKIAMSHPSLKTITKEDMVKEYQLLYDYESGIFLLLMIICFVSFGVILYDKASGLRSEEKREIGILKAIGWEISHIINYKLMEALILSLSAFIVALALAIFYVYVLDAPVLKYVFAGYSDLKQPFELVFRLDIKTIAMIFFLTVPLYIAVSIIPAWRIATMDAGEVMR
ncbi:MAG: FtsX-like permease family protein [Campylobacteraceae bacterium]|nr:FtsX-like permease family protein [Campylobacteraceae bacterium]